MNPPVFFDDVTARGNLLPLAFTRPIAEFRVGILTIREKWLHCLHGSTDNRPSEYITADYLAEKYPFNGPKEGANERLFLAGNVCPGNSVDFGAKVKNLRSGEALLTADGTLVAFCGTYADFIDRNFKNTVTVDEPLNIIRHLYDIFTFNADEILKDFPRVTVKPSQPLSPSNRIIGPERDAEGRPMVYLAEGAKAECVIFNTTRGPIYLGPDSEVMEGSCLRGPVALCTHGTINMCSKIYPATTIGPWCKVGGEVNNIVMFGYSNKSHDGYLGNAVLGEWCNIGAGCVSSNLKNNYAEIRLWNYPTHRFERTGLQFCGLIMGDHSKAGINVMFNTATVVGVGSSIYGDGFPRTYIPSFKEGGAAGFADMPLTKFYDIATRVMARRNRELTDADRAIFAYLHEHAND